MKKKIKKHIPAAKPSPPSQSGSQKPNPVVWGVVAAVVVISGVLLFIPKPDQQPGISRNSQETATTRSAEEESGIPAPEPVAVQPSSATTSNTTPLSATSSILQEPTWMDTNSTSDLINFGNRLLKEGYTKEAEAYYQRAVDLELYDEDAFYSVAFAANLLGEKEKAVTNYLMAIEIYPDYMEARNNLANIYLEMGRTNEAVEQLEKALDFDPDYALARNSLGRIRVGQQQYREAFEQYQKAAEVRPEFFEAQLNLGSAALRLQSNTIAVAALEKAVELDPSSPVASKLLAQGYALNGQIEESIQIFESMLSQNANQPDVLFNLGQVYLNNRMHQKAVDTFTKLLNQFPDFPLGREALNQAQKALERGVHLPDLKSSNQ